MEDKSDDQRNISMGIAPEICLSLLAGVLCTNPNCKHIHMNHAKITLTDLLKIDDLFYIVDLQNSGVPINTKFTEREKELLTLPRPVLCDVCKMPVHADEDFYFPCCNVFICVSCQEKRPSKNSCATCGRTRTDDQNFKYQEKLDEVRQRNAGYNNIEILQFD